MAEPARRRMTVEEFLAFEDGTDTRHELVGGELVAMAPPLERHSTVAFAVATAIAARLPSGCRGLVEAGIRLDESNLFQADLAVSCAPVDPEGLVRDPVLIVEVLSDGTRRFDLGEKADRYSQLPSCREIWLVDSTRPWLRLWRRSGDLWTVTLPITQGSFRSEVLGAEVPVVELYRGTDLLEAAG